MSDRPAPLLIAAGLLLVIGLSGLAAGISIVAAMGQVTTLPMVGVEIGSAIAVYGLLATIAGIGLLFRGRRAWWLGVATIGAGLAFLVGLVIAIHGDPVFAFGIGIWGLTLACLVAPPTRVAIRR